MEQKTRGVLNSTQSGSQGEGRDQGDDQADNGKMTHKSNRQKTMGVIDEGPHPAVDRQSLVEM